MRVYTLHIITLTLNTKSNMQVFCFDSILLSCFLGKPLEPFDKVITLHQDPLPKVTRILPGKDKTNRGSISHHGIKCPKLTVKDVNCFRIRWIRMRK